MSALVTELRQADVKTLVPYVRNARTHSEAQVAEIAGSIKAFGFTNPILVSEDGVVVAGHGRLAAARLLGMTQVPVITLRGLTETQRRALALADNRIALNAGWDVEMLKLELTELQELGVAVDLLGFTDAEIAAALTPVSEGLTDPDEVPPLEPPVSVPGDLWVLGRHRLLCGDATVATDVARLLGEVKPLLMVTDPPYGVEYDAKWRTEAGLQRKAATGAVANDDRADWTEAWSLFPGDVVYVWHGGLHAATVQASLEAAGFEIRTQIIWVKSQIVISRGHYHWQHEPCWYAVRKGATGHWSGDRSQSTVWQVAHKKSETGHSTQKPVECMQRPIVNNSSPGQVVYEPFLGSGTTVIAAETLGRSCLAIEINPSYVDVAIRRWQAFTGQAATLLDGGTSFADVAAARCPEAPPTESVASGT